MGSDGRRRVRPCFDVGAEAHDSRRLPTTSLTVLACRAGRRSTRSWRSAGMRTPTRGECSPTVVPSDVFTL